MVNKETVYQISFLARVFPVNCYLVEEEDGLTLIDAAFPYSAKKILRTATEMGRPITRIMLTHAHSDHVGALDELKQTLPEVPVYISSRDARLLECDKSLDSNEDNLPIRGGITKNLKTRADVLLKDGDQVGSLLAIATPGHTPGSMSFLDVRNKALIAGDALQTRGGIAVAGHMRPLFPFPALATWNKRAAIESADKILKLEPELLATGHGKILEQPMPFIRQAIKQAKQKLNKKTR